MNHNFNTKEKGFSFSKNESVNKKRR